jgi:uncharacterized SAM-dependent methyltransferase
MPISARLPTMSAKASRVASSEHFYDARGSELFERICRLPEYYLQTEISAKFTRERLRSDLAAAGLLLDGWHTDRREPVRS